MMGTTQAERIERMADAFLGKDLPNTYSEGTDTAHYHRAVVGLLASIATDLGRIADALETPDRRS